MQKSIYDDETLSKKCSSYLEKHFDRGVFNSVCCMLYAAVNQKKKNSYQKRWRVIDRIKLENYFF